jgi:hypothetical protein
VNHHVSAALAHERIAQALRRAETEMIGSLGTRRPHGSFEVPPVAREAARARGPELRDEGVL